jgi:hypothetical protein
MKLITEVREKIEVLKEENNLGKQDYYISGIFMQAEQANKNERVYPLSVLQRVTKTYIDEYISKNRAFGELGHPEGPIINLERVSHMIKELHQDGNNFRGKAKILDTPYGRIVKNLIDEGASLGVSSRGIGSLIRRGSINEVQEDFCLSTPADIVADPSAPAAFVDGLRENKEWIYENGVFISKDIESYKKQLDNKKLKDTEKLATQLFEDFIKKLGNNF